MLPQIYIKDIAVILSVQFILCSAQVNYTSEINGIEFMDLELLLDTTHNVTHLDVDELMPGSLLFSYNHSIYSVDLQQQPLTPTVLVGMSNSSSCREGTGVNASFGFIQSFIQLSSLEILVADTNCHRLRLIDRETNATNRLAGTSDFTSSHADGYFHECGFVSPVSLIHDDMNFHVYVLQMGGEVRRLNLITSIVSTLPMTLSADMSRSLSFDRINSILYTLSKSSLKSYDTNTKSVSPVKNFVTSGYTDGPLASSKFGDVQTMYEIFPSILIIADVSNRVLRVVDIHRKVVSTLCTRPRAVSPGCRPLNLTVNSLVYFNSTSILLGLTDGIQILRIVDPRTTSSTTTVTTTTSTTTNPSVTMNTSLLTSNDSTTTYGEVTSSAMISTNVTHSSTDSTTTQEVNVSTETNKNTVDLSKRDSKGRILAFSMAGSGAVILIAVIACVLLREKWGAKQKDEHWKATDSYIDYLIGGPINTQTAGYGYSTYYQPTRATQNQITQEEEEDEDPYKYKTE